MSTLWMAIDVHDEARLQASPHVLVAHSMKPGRPSSGATSSVKLISNDATAHVTGGAFSLRMSSRSGSLQCARTERRRAMLYSSSAAQTDGTSPSGIASYQNRPPL
jgi:hypothetical protein